MNEDWRRMITRGQAKEGAVPPPGVIMAGLRHDPHLMQHPAGGRWQSRAEKPVERTGPAGY